MCEHELCSEIWYGIGGRRNSKLSEHACYSMLPDNCWPVEVGLYPH
jgi:hypothetical protein